MSDFWHGLVNYKPKKTMKAIHRGGYKKVYPEKFAEVREQIQEDIITFIDSVVPTSSDEYRKNALCQIVVDNFKKLED